MRANVLASSRTPHGVRGLKCDWGSRTGNTISRTPHGVRGLKSLRLIALVLSEAGRTPHGVRGLKSRERADRRGQLGRTPHGVRGLKYVHLRGDSLKRLVAPLTGCVD